MSANIINLANNTTFPNKSPSPEYLPLNLGEHVHRTHKSYQLVKRLQFEYIGQRKVSHLKMYFKLAVNIDPNTLKMRGYFVK